MSSPACKIDIFRLSEAYDCIPASRLHRRGVSRSSRTWEAGCGGREAAQRASARGRKLLRGRSSRVVPIPRRWPDAGFKSCVTNARRRWLTSPVHLGEHGAAVNTIAQGVPVVSAALWFLACAMCTFLCTQGSRVRPASGTPCALFLGAMLCKPRADRVARMQARVDAAAARMIRYVDDRELNKVQGAK
jgi:hypothetical protein